MKQAQPVTDRSRSDRRAARRPGLVWVVVILCLLAAGSQILNHTLVLMATHPASPELRAYFDSWTILDKVTPG